MAKFPKRTYRRRRRFQKKAQPPHQLGNNVRTAGSSVRHNLTSLGFWGRVGATALTYIRAAAEAKRLTNLFNWVNVVDNKIADYSTPTVSAIDGIWHVLLYSAGLQQGSQQDERIGNKILVRNISGHIKLTADANSNLSSSTTVRVILFRAQRNYLNDDPIRSPLPATLYEWPNYKDSVQILMDQTFVLSPYQTDGALKHFNFHRKVNQPMIFKDDADTGPEKGTIYIAVATDKSSQGPNTGGQIQMTFTDMMA